MAIKIQNTPDLSDITDVWKIKFKNSTKALDTFYSIGDYLITSEKLIKEIKLDDLGNATTNWILFYIGNYDITEINTKKDLGTIADFIAPFIRTYNIIPEIGDDTKSLQDMTNDELNNYLKENPFNTFVRLFNIRVDVYDNPNIKYVDVLGGDSTFKNTIGQSKTIQLTAKIASPISEYFDVYKIRAFKNMMDYPTRVNFYNPELEEIYGFSSAIVKNYSIRQNRQYNNIKDISATLIAPQ